MRIARYSRVLIFIVCVLLVFAVAATLLLNNIGQPFYTQNGTIADTGESADEVSAAYPVLADGYAHGSNIGRSASGVSVSTADAFYNAITNSQDINLQNDITLSSSQSFRTSGTYSGTIYGNGHTVTVTGAQTTSSGITGNMPNNSEIGGLMSKLSGRIYDLNVALKSGTSASYINSSGSTAIRLGLIAGVIDGGTIENCTVTIPSGSKLYAVSATGASTNTGANTGAIAGQSNGSMTIKNVTVTNNGKIIGALGTSFSSADSYRLGSGTAAMFVAFIWNDQSSYTQIMNNVVAKGTGTIEGWAASVLGMTYSSSSVITVNNYYNQFTGTYSYGSTSGGIFGSGSTALVSYSLLKWAGDSDASKVVNYYHSSGTDQSKMASGFYAVPDRSITVSSNEYTVYFDPRQTDLSNSLAIVKTGVTGGENYTATLQAANGTNYSDNYAFNDAGNTVIFRRLPTDISYWGGNNGTFNCTINISQNTIEVTPVPAVNKWESSYYGGSAVTTGTRVTNGAELASAISANSSDIYLANDIEDFTGFNTSTFSHTIYGNGHTVYIVRSNANSGNTVGGLMGTLTGTVKDLRVVLYSSYNRSINTNKIGTGIIAGHINGGTVNNVYVYIPSGVTFGANGNSSYESYVGAIAGYSEGNGYTISNTTVDIDGEIRLDGSWIYMSAFVGKSQATATRANFNLTNVTLRGSGSYDSDYSASDEPIFLGASTVLFTSDGVSGNATININGFINDFQGSVAAQNYSMYGILTQNKKTGTLTGWTINVSNVYDYDTPLADVNKTTTGNKYIDVSSGRHTVSTVVEDSSIKVKPYFPAGDTDNLVLVAGDGNSECPFVTYNGTEGVKDDNYMVVSVPKANIPAQTTVQLTLGKQAVSDPVLASNNLIYGGEGLDVSIEQLMSGSSQLAAENYTVAITAKDGGTGSVEDNKPVNAGDYKLTVTLLNGYKFADDSTEKAVDFTVNKATLIDMTADVVQTYDGSAHGITFNLSGFVLSENIESAGGVVQYSADGTGNWTADAITATDYTQTAVTVYYTISFANYNTVSGNKTITINKKEVTIANVTATDREYDGTTEVELRGGELAGTVPDDTVSFDLGTGTAASANAGNDISVTTAITLSGTDAGNYNLVQPVVTVNIAKKAVTIDVNSATVEKTYDGEAFSDFASLFTAPEGVNGEGALTLDYEAVGALTDGAILNAGNYTVNAKLADNAVNANYEASVASVAYNVSAMKIEKPAPEIPTLVYNAGEQGITVAESDYYTVSGTTSATNAGSYEATVTLKDKVNTSWADGTTDDLTFEWSISRKEITVPVPEEQSFVYTGQEQTYLIEESSDYTVSGNKGTNAGSYEATVALNDKTNTYWADEGKTDVDKVFAWSIAKKEIDVPSISDKAYTGEVLKADVEGNEYYTVTKNDGGSEVGEYDVVLTLKDANNYKWSTGEESAEITLKFNIVASGNSWIKEPEIQGWTYGEAPNSPVYKAEKGDETAVVEYRLQSGIDEDYKTVEDLSTLGAGAYYMRVSIAKTDDYGGLSKVVDFTIAKADISVSVIVEGWTYGGEANSPEVSGNSGSGALSFLYNGTANDGTDLKDSAVAPSKAGIYTVTVTVAETDNYNGTTATSAQFTVARATVDDSAVSIKGWTYGQYDESVNAPTVSVNPEDAAVTYVYEGVDGTVYEASETAPTKAGTYSVKATAEQTANYEGFEAQAATFTIAKATVDVPAIESKPYNGKTQTATVEESELYSVMTNDGGTAAGSYEVVIALNDKGNYAWASEDDNNDGIITVEFEITKAANSWMSEPAISGWTYGESASEPSGAATFGKTAFAYKTAEGGALEAIPSDAGSYILVATVEGTADYDGLSKEVAFEIAKKKIDAPALAQSSFEYNGGEISVSLVATDGVTLSGQTTGTDTAEYKAIASLTDKTNTEWIGGGTDDVELIWHVTVKAVTLKAEQNVEKMYDGSAYDFSEYVVSGADGFYARDNVSVSVSAGEIYIPGSYAIEVSHNANGNYDVTVEASEAKLTITQATLTITAQEAEIEYSGHDVEFAFDITAGVVGDDEVSIGSVVYKQNGAAVQPSAIGAYVAEFTLTGAQAGYYVAQPVTVTVKAPTTEAPADMTADNIVLPDGELVYNGEAHNATLDYTPAEGDDSVYGLIYYLDGNPVENAVDAGEYTIRVYKGSAIYLIEGIEKTMTVAPMVLTADDIVVSGTSFTYSGGPNNVTASGRGVKGETVTLTVLYDGEASSPVNAGVYTVTFVSADPNYEVEEGFEASMTVGRKPIDKPIAIALTYNGEEQTAFAQSADYSVGGEFKATDVSESGYTATFTLTSDNYKWSNEDDAVREMSVEWNITPAVVEITASGAATSKTYDGIALTAQELAALFTAPDKIGGGKVEIIATVDGGAEVRDAGEYKVAAVVNDVNYTAQTVTVTYTVDKAQASVQIKVQEKLLQEGDKLSTVGVSNDGETPGTVVWDEPETVLVKGDNVVNWTFIPDDEKNYNGASGSVTLNVGDDVLTDFVLVEEESDYKTEYVAFEDFDGTGIVLKATFNGTIEQTVTLAECQITIENATKEGKMSGATTKVTIAYGNKQVEIYVTVSKIAVDVPVPEVAEFEYNATAQTVTLPSSDLYNVVGGDTATDVSNDLKVQIELTDAVNYCWADGTTDNKQISWRITPVTVAGVITLPDNLVYDGNAKIATFELTEGTLYGGAQMTITYELTDGTVLAGAPVDAGKYEVVATLPDTTNYRFAEGTPYSKAMTVEKKTVEIITIGSREKVYDGVEVTAAELAEHFSVTDGLTVKVTVNGTVLNAGIYQITAEIDEKNYRAEPISCTYTVRKADKTISAGISVGYLSVQITVDGDSAGAEYSSDGNVWRPLDGAIAVELKPTYSFYVRYAESDNYNASAAVKVEGNITKAALAEYAAERFTGTVTLADAADIAKLESLAQAAQGEDAEFDATLARLTAERERLVNGATAAVENALKAGGALRGYAGVVTALALTLGGFTAAAAIGLCVIKRKGGKKNEEK